MKQILLVENDAIFGKMLSMLLTQENFSVTIAKDGKEAAKALACGQFDLVISDIFMPYSNGFELLHDVRKNKQTGYIPFIVVSDVSNQKSIDNCFRLGADAYHTKPLNMPAFLTEIKNLILTQRNVAA
ncbi:MAG: response regulator [Sediminibacterium sp.]